jgi:hypothetical protein
MPRAWSAPRYKVKTANTQTPAPIKRLRYQPSSQHLAYPEVRQGRGPIVMKQEVVWLYVQVDDRWFSAVQERDGFSHFNHEIQLRGKNKVAQSLKIIVLTFIINYIYIYIYIYIY